MNIVIFCCCFLFILPLNGYQSPSRSPSLDYVKSVVLALTQPSNNLSDLLLESEQATSQRLGIAYEGVQNKFLIGANVDSTVGKGIRDGTLPYDLHIDSLEEDFSRATLFVSQKNYSYTCYFKGEKLVSPMYYITKHWMKWESKTCTFLISDTTLFNRYAIDRLERFIDSTAALLKYTDADRELLRKNKIIYVLCRDQHEIEQITGFATLGMYVLAYDAVVTTYNCHYHELLHLLMNFKLKHLPLYTHPFLQEGFAVAYGGRGGKEPNMILDAGYFLMKSGMSDYSSLLSRTDFLQQDPSITYAISGLYNAFLIREIGIDRYLQLYRNYSMNESEINSAVIDSTTLPARDRWEKFLGHYLQYNNISSEISETIGRKIFSNRRGSIFDAGDSYLVRLKDTLLFSPKSILNNYHSSRFKELFPKDMYHGEKYAIISGELEAGIYNLYTNNLIAGIIGPFCVPPKKLERKNGMFEILIRKSLFDEEIETMRIE